MALLPAAQRGGVHVRKCACTQALTVPVPRTAGNTRPFHGCRYRAELSCHSTAGFIDSLFQSIYALCKLAFAGLVRSQRDGLCCAMLLIVGCTTLTVTDLRACHAGAAPVGGCRRRRLCLYRGKHALQQPQLLDQLCHQGADAALLLLCLPFDGTALPRHTCLSCLWL